MKTSPNKIPQIEEILSALGDILDAQRISVALVVVGGAALILDQHVQRATSDIDVIAISQEPNNPSNKLLSPPDRLAQDLAEPIRTIARDYDLPSDWLNTVVAAQWKTGLPHGFHERVHWRRLGKLWVGTADRYDLVFLKLYAAADDVGTASVHFQDLLALEPTREELEETAKWVKSQDVSDQFAEVVEQVVEHAKRDR
jgi:hypothetical protein